ncbi:MAG: YceI family protein [Gemmatimonadota bacterium]
MRIPGLLLTYSIVAASVARPAWGQVAVPGWEVLSESRLEVLTQRGGLLSFFGHDHLVRAERFEGTLSYSPADPSAASVRLVVDAASVRVLTSADSADLGTIQRDMELKVLKPSEFPTIEFTSDEVEADGDRLRIKGVLALVGVERPVELDAVLAAEGDTLEASGEFEIRLRDFGIEPPTAAAGTVKVKNEVTFRIHLLARRLPG